MMNKQEIKMEKVKKTEKPLADPHREFLDMDTDEEDYGRQESPETEEELPPEPIKPVFEEEDLDKLIQYVKDFIIFPSIKDCDWKDNCLAIVREYFENPVFTLLSIYFEADVLKARLGIPEIIRNGFVYFLRTPWHVFTVNNFHTTVIFGSINRDVKMCILKLMENMYVPIALNSDQWSEIVKNNLFFNLHNFLMCLTEQVYKPMGLTKLYVPRENLPNIAAPLTEENSNLSKKNDRHITNELTESEKALVERFEGIVRHWIKQIREVLAKAPMCETRRTIFDELQHWTAIYFDLHCVRNQLSYKEIQSILHLLENIRSPSVDSFQLLTTQLLEGLEQAASNVTYLNILSEACNDLKCPDEIEASMTKILLLMLFIWIESPFYNMNNIEILCEAVSIQVLNQCKDYIDLQALLEGDAENGIDTLQKCISCCQAYRAIYDNVISIIIHIKSNNSWNVNEHIVFNSIDTFMQRCYDIIEICNALIVFGRCNKVGLIGGAKGTEHETHCRRIEDLFYENLDEIKQFRDDILDVANFTWPKNMQKFRDSMTELENMVKNLINRIFEDVENVEEGIEAIYALQRFRHKESLRDLLSTKWVQVWKIFGKEIESCNNSTTLHDMYHLLFPHYSEDTIILCTIRYLERQFRIMIDASDWIGDCAAEKYVLEQYKQVMSVISNKISYNKS